MGKQIDKLPLYAAIIAILMVMVSSSIVVLISDSPAYQDSKAHAASKFKYAGSWSGTLKGMWTEAYPQEESRWSSEIKLAFTVQDVGSGENSAPLAGKAKVLLQQPHYVHHDPNIPRASMQISPTEYTVGITGSISLDPPLLTIYPDAEPPIAATLVFYPEEGEPNTWQGTWQTGVLWLFEKLTYAEKPAPAGIGKVLALSTSYQSDAYSVSATGEVTTVQHPTFGLFIVAKVEYGEVKVVREGEEHTIIIDNMQTVEYDEYSGEETRENYYTLQVGDTIITELETRVEIVVPEEDARILVEENSYIRIQQQGRRGEIDWQFGFSRGKTWIAIDGARFNIYTPSAVLGTLGTRFSLEVSEDGTTTLTVIDGIVKFSDLDLRKTVEVGQYQTSTVRPDEMPSDPVSIDPGDIARWWEKPA
ncbi:MAG: FecR domain-containing protein, partial [Candidatus Bathyarchaeia archaeon]